MKFWKRQAQRYSILIVCMLIVLPLPDALAQEVAQPVEINGDIVEFVIEENKMVAKGNVIVEYQGSTLKCDVLEFDRNSKIGIAKGNVVLITEDGESRGDRLEFNFNTMKGNFNGAKLIALPFYGAGERVDKVGENHMVLKNGYLTTCDLDDPHWRFKAKEVDVYPQDKAVARNVKMYVGKIPILFIPRYTRDLTNKKPRFTFIPGQDKEWGGFLLTQWRYTLNEYVKGKIHVDYRERKDLASGIDLEYKTDSFGSGLFRTYYMNERNITSKHFYQERPSPTIEKERFKVEWRHKWEIDDKTDAILQYYRLSDNSLLKDYFRSEYREDAEPRTYFLFTHSLARGTLSFQTDIRVNRFTSAVERLPEIRYDLVNQEIASTGLYVRSSNLFSNLTKKTAAPSEARQKTMRYHTDNAISYPMKVGFIEMRPWVGGSNTYYSRTKDPDEYGSIRGQFKTGASLSTKFYRIFDVKTKIWKLDINRLRHIVTPSVEYQYKHDPTITIGELDQFDSIDSMQRGHSMSFSVENKLQTKRNNKSVDLVRATVSTPFYLKEDPSQGGFGNIRSEVEVTPNDWVRFYFDSTYETHRDRMNMANFDLYINGKKGSVSIGKRWQVDSDDQITAELIYELNPKWTFRVYERFEFTGGGQKEQEYTVTRDLHCWKMDMSFNERAGAGSEIWVVFTLKAFPDMEIFDFGTSFNQRKAGSQSSYGD